MFLSKAFTKMWDKIRCLRTVTRKRFTVLQMANYLWKSSSWMTQVEKCEIDPQITQVTKFCNKFDVPIENMTQDKKMYFYMTDYPIDKKGNPIWMEKWDTTKIKIPFTEMEAMCHAIWMSFMQNQTNALAGMIGQIKTLFRKVWVQLVVEQNGSFKKNTWSKSPYHMVTRKPPWTEKSKK